MGVAAAFRQRSSSRRRHGGADGGGDLAGEAREFLLDRLELADLAAELDALAGVAHRQFERGFERAGDLQ